MEILRLIYIGLQSFSQGMISMLFDPNIIINPITLIVIFLIASQYKSIMSIQRQMYGGRVRHRLRDLVASSILAGILAGLAGSIIITVVGVTFVKLSGLIIVIAVSLLLMFFINPRYVCLSYSGGILSLCSLVMTALISRGYVNQKEPVVGYLQKGLNFDVTALMVVIAVMHLVESILMWLDGHRGAVPVFMKRNGKLVGGFIMQRLWIIPILFFIVISSSEISGQTIPTPHWWPIIGPNVPRATLNNLIFSATMLLAMLGYSDFTISTPVVQKVRRSAVKLFLYSLILLTFALISYKVYIFKYVAALFAPLAHEGLILYERFKETSGKPIWGYSDDGVIVVDTIPSSPAEKIGIKSGDKLVQINNNPVSSIEDIMKFMGQYLNYVWIEIINIKGEKRMVEYSNYTSGINELGIITVPRDERNIVFVEERDSNLFKRLTGRNKR